MGKKSTATEHYKRDIVVPLNGLELHGILCIPNNTTGIVIFSHGHGSSRLSPRNTYVASILEAEGMATLLIDLLTEDEDESSRNRFDIALITERLVAITQWVNNNQDTKALHIAYFGASTGAAVALNAATTENVIAVVSRGGRPDLVSNDLYRVKAPTLLIVGGNDHDVLKWNEQAFKRLQVEKQLEVISGASHLFQEKGKLERVAALAANWFNHYFQIQTSYHV